MKKLVLFLLLFIPFKVFGISASSYIVMDGSSGRVLGGSNINDKRLIASTTKIMTAVITLENGDINSEVVVDNDVLKAYGSAIYIEIGEKIKLIDLLYGLMLRSGNDAAIEIANNVTGSMDSFVQLMNDKARDLGMKNTTFVNNNGLEEKTGENISTSYDMALLMRYALGNDTFKKIVGTKEYVVKTNYKTYEWHNKNRLLTEYKYTIGGKTGYTKKALRTLVTAAQKDNKTLIVVTLNDPNDFEDHRYLYESYFKQYNLVKVLNKNNIKIPDSNIKGYIDNDYNILLTPNEEKKIKVDYEINNEIVDEKIGKAIIMLDDKKIDEIPIYSTKRKTESKKWYQKLWDFIIFWK